MTSVREKSGEGMTLVKRYINPGEGVVSEG
jgi:hypothetical protein